MEALKKAPKEAPAIYENRLRLSESVVLDYFITVEEGVTREDIQRPEFWAHVAKRFRPFTKLRVTTDDSQYYVELIVIRAGDNWAVVREVLYQDINGTDNVAELVEDSKLFYTKYKGTLKQWCVIRKSDNQIIQEGITGKEAAELALNEYTKVIEK